MWDIYKNAAQSQIKWETFVVTQIYMVKELHSLSSMNAPL